MTDEKRPRSARIKSIRISEIELAAIKENAQWAGMTFSAYVRQECLKGVVQQVPPMGLAADDLEELRAASDELNAIAKANHIHRGVDSPRLQNALTRLRRVLAKLPAE